MDPVRGFSLAIVVLLSLVLPLTANAWGKGTSGRTFALRTVWIGQWLGAIGGLWVVAAPVHPEYGAVAAILACLACLPVLQRRMRPA